MIRGPTKDSSTIKLKFIRQFTQSFSILKGCAAILSIHISIELERDPFFQSQVLRDCGGFCAGVVLWRRNLNHAFRGRILENLR